MTHIATSCVVIFDMPNLKSITIPSGVTYIGFYSVGFYSATEYASSAFVSDVDTPGTVEYLNETLIPGFTIYGYAGTAAETYAQRNGITFSALDSSSQGESDSTVSLSACTISSLTNVAKGIKIKWTQVSGASGYIIYRKSGTGSYSKVKTIKNGSTVSYTDKKIAGNNGTVYTYMVQSIILHGAAN
ncbi:MAG: hypothetical protein LUF27_09405 [Lachnospiraceae bacterium]|nr:hypothetical protein [Lachnospiraceae bacterium]